MTFCGEKVLPTEPFLMWQAMEHGFMLCQKPKGHEGECAAPVLVGITDELLS